MRDFTFDVLPDAADEIADSLGIDAHVDDTDGLLDDDLMDQAESLFWEELF